MSMQGNPGPSVSAHPGSGSADQVASSPSTPLKGPAAADGLPPAQRIAALIAISVAVGMATLDTAIANTALPTIAAEPGYASAAQVDLGGQRLPARDGRDAAAVRCARARSSGTAASISAGCCCSPLASLACGLADSLPTLSVAARVLQGLGAAAIMSVNTALIRFAYPARTTGPRPRHQRHDRGDRLHGRPDRGLGDPVGRHLALAVPDQRAVRPRRDRALLARPAGDAARGARLRQGRRGALRGLPGAVDPRASVPCRRTADGRPALAQWGVALVCRRCCCTGRRVIRRRCWRSTCSRGPSSRCRRSPPSAPSRPRAWPSSRCPSCCRTCWATARSKPAS